MLALLAPIDALAELKQGPVLLASPPTDLGAPTLIVGKKSLERGALPQLLLTKANELLKSGKDIVLVGFTDPMGPKDLNESLGLQYAVNLSYRLAKETKTPHSRFRCASQGEIQDQVDSGIKLFEIQPPKEAATEKSGAVAILSPRPGDAPVSAFWALWNTGANPVYWGVKTPDGEHFLWELENSAPPARMPFPVLSSELSLGGSYEGKDWVKGSNVGEAEVLPHLMLSTDTVEAGWARLVGRVPPGYTDVVVWGGGIPYPIVLDEGRIEADIVVFEPDMVVYAQAVDPKGRLAVGPPVNIPLGAEGVPKLVAVLQWDTEEVDLDLHAWSGPGHTHPLDPDPTYSATAVDGVKILFDGGQKRRYSALWADDISRLELEVRCFADLGNGANAYMYVIKNPGDPELRENIIFGPRRLSGSPLEQRWPVMFLKGENQ